jgi:hypothetical protein
MGYSASWEAESRSDGQKRPRLSWKPNLYSCLHKCPTRNLLWISSSVHALASQLYILNTYFNYRPIFPSLSSLPSCLFSLGFLIKILIHFSSPYGCCMRTGFKWLRDVSNDGPLWTRQWNKLDTEVNKKPFLCRETNSVVQPVAIRFSRFTDWAICHHSWVVSRYL